MNLQVANFQRCEHAFTCRHIKLVHVSGVHFHVRASSTGSCAFVYFIVYSTVVQYIYFKPRMSGCPLAIRRKSCYKPRMSGSKRESSSDVAGTAKKYQLLYCTTVLFKVLYCKIKNVLFFVFYVLFV